MMLVVVYIIPRWSEQKLNLVSYYVVAFWVSDHGELL